MHPVRPFPVPYPPAGMVAREKNLLERTVCEPLAASSRHFREDGTLILLRMIARTEAVFEAASRD